MNPWDTPSGHSYSTSVPTYTHYPSYFGNPCVGEPSVLQATPPAGALHHYGLAALPPTPSTPTNRGKKRTRVDENSDAEDSETEGPVREALSPRRARGSRAKRQKSITDQEKLTRSSEAKRRAPLTDQEKLSRCFSTIRNEAGWSLAMFLKNVFMFQDESKDPTHNSKTHAQSLRHFLQGNTTFKPAHLIDLMLRHPYGRLSATSGDTNGLFVTSPDWHEIAPVRQALTGFAAQIVRRQLIHEADEAVKPESGLHATVPKKLRGAAGDQSNAPKRSWSAIGSATFGNVKAIVERCQPLTWQYALDIAEGPERRRKQKAGDTTNSEGVARRRYRPSHVVALQAVTSLDFSRTNRANLFPTATGLLYFAMSAPVDLMHYGARLGTMPSYNTIYTYLEDLADVEAAVLRELGQDETKGSVLYVDNVQNYLLEQDVRIGRGSRLISGVAGTYIEAVNCDITAFDLARKRELLLENRRADMTVEQLFDFIDSKHQEVVGVLQFLYVLTEHIPELGHYRAQVAELYRTRAAKLRVPVTQSTVINLRSSGKKETVTTEFRDVILNFLEQLGRMAGERNPRLVIIGGDGLTFEKTINLKNLLAHISDDAFQSLEIVEAVLALWHLGWTELSRIFATHWGPSLSKDESTLGHNAKKINRKTPPNLNKVDYKQGTETLFTVLDARILDCFRVHYDVVDLHDYFEELAREKQLPTFEQLELVAQQLYRAYATSRGYERAMHTISSRDRETCLGSDNKPLSSWEKTVPLGSPWVFPPGSSTGREQLSKELEGNNPFQGDRVLAQSIALIRDAVVLREFVLATCEGDVGRVYEAMKVMLFTFAGSSHSKYTSYLLETVCNLELESTPELRHAILSNMVVNLTGKPGAFQPGDLMQEYFNRLLEAVVDRKGVDYGNHFIRNIISPNLHHFARLLDDLKDGVGLQHRSGRHSDPHQKPEHKILAHIYRNCELHSRRPGREPLDPARDVDQFHAGYKKLQDGKLAKWIRETIFMRSVRIPPPRSANTQSPDMPHPMDADEDEDVDGVNELGMEGFGDDEGEGPDMRHMPLAVAHMVDGELIVQDVDFQMLAADLLEGTDESDCQTTQVDET